MNKLRAGWHKFLEFHRTLIIPNLAKLTEDQRKNTFDYYFEKAKKLSDFVAIIIRWSVAQFAMHFFFQSSKQSDFWLAKYTYMFCAFIAAAVTIYLSVYVTIITLLYWASDIPKQKSRAFKILVSTGALLNTAMLWFGINHLVRTIAQASQLLGNP